MRTRERLLGAKAWCEKNLCDRELKSPGEKKDLSDVQMKKPEVYLAWRPQRYDSGRFSEDEYMQTRNAVPFIQIMPAFSDVKNMEEQRFDRYNNIKRPKDMGQSLVLDILFCVYEPGIRKEGFTELASNNGKGLDGSLLMDGTEEGLFTLTEWMDDCKECLLRDLQIEGTDLILDEQHATYSLYTDQAYVVDKRPLYYGFIRAKFNCYAENRHNEVIANLID